MSTTDTSPSVEDCDIPFLSLTDENFGADPFGTWETLRRDHWLVQSEMGFNVLPYSANFDLVHSRQLDPRFDDTILRMQGVTEGPASTYWNEGLLMGMEASKHDRIRKLLTATFTPTAVEALRPAATDIAESLVDQLLHDGESDFVETFADQFPVRVFAHLMGVPSDDIDQFTTWSSDLGMIFMMPIHPVLDQVNDAVTGLFAYAADLIEQRRQTPADDLTTKLISAEEAEQLTAEELQWQILNLIFSGHDSSRAEMGAAAALLCENPEQFQRLRSNPALVDNAAEEIVRIRPSIPQTTRTVLEDMEYGGVRFPAGTKFVLRSDCANRDPEVFDDPAAFNIERENANRHLSFGGGRTYCLGASLARTELEVALEVLSRRVSKMTATGNEFWRPAASGIQGPISFGVEVSPA